MQFTNEGSYTAIATNATLIDNSLHSFLIHIFENFARLIPALAPFHELVNSAIELTLRLGFLLFLFVLCSIAGQGIAQSRIASSDTRYPEPDTRNPIPGSHYPLLTPPPRL